MKYNRKWKSKALYFSQHHKRLVIFFATSRKESTESKVSNKGRYLSITAVDQPRSQLDVRFFSTKYYIWPGVGVLARKSRLVMKGCSFLGHKYSFFNAIVSHLTASVFAPWNPTRALSQTRSCNYHHFPITFSLFQSLYHS